MPLARIFTHHPERTAALSSQLQEQGYTVEVVHPDQGHLSPADLEIEFEICERADVLERAAGLAEELQADVAVAPGAIQQPAPQTKAQPVQNSAAAEAAIARERDRESEFEAAFSESSEPAEEPRTPVIEIPVMERAPLPPVAFADEPPAARMRPELAKPADPVPYLAQLTPFGRPQIEGEIPGAELRLENSPEREPARPALVEARQEPPAPTGPSIWQRGADFTAKAVANARAITASAVESFRERSQEYKMKAKIRSAEARAAHEARLLDLEQRRAEAQQRATELETAREAAAARLVELVRQRDPGLQGINQSEPDIGAQSLREESFLASERKASPTAASVSRPSGKDTWWQAAMAVVAKRRQRPPMSPQLRAVLTGAAAVSILFVIGIVLGALYPRAPLAKPSGQASSSTPGGNMAAHNGAAGTKAGAPVSVQDKPSPAKSPQTRATTAAAQTPAQDKPSPRAEQVRRVAAQQGEEEIGDDVVVRHFKRPVPTQKPRQSGQQAGLKHFSDLDESPSPR
jgi:hypothetical protein